MGNSLEEALSDLLVMIVNSIFIGVLTGFLVWLFTLVFGIGDYNLMQYICGASIAVLTAFILRNSFLNL